MEIGKYHTLKIARSTKVGLFLVNETEEVLLPNKYVPKEYHVGDDITVFVYLDHEERLVATTLKPFVQKNNFAVLKVNYTNSFGAFLDWGLEKDIFAPFKEQANPMEKDKRYPVFVFVDEKTNRLVASSKINKFFDQNISELEVNQEVDVMVTNISTIGAQVVINGKYKGLAYLNEIFTKIYPGYSTKAFIKSIREDGKIDVRFQKSGFEAIDEFSKTILDKLKECDNFLPLTDNSEPEEIKNLLKMSKKSFKKGIGTLYKQHLIAIEEKGIRLA